MPNLAPLNQIENAARIKRINALNQMRHALNQIEKQTIFYATTAIYA